MPAVAVGEAMDAYDAVFKTQGNFIGLQISDGGLLNIKVS